MLDFKGCSMTILSSEKISEDGQLLINREENVDNRKMKCKQFMSLWPKIVLIFTLVPEFQGDAGKENVDSPSPTCSTTFVHF